MKTALVVLCVLCISVMGFQCPPSAGVSVTITDESIGISVSEVEGGIEITNTSEVAIIVSVESPEGEQQFELDVGESVTVTGITEPIRVSVVAAGG